MDLLEKLAAVPMFATLPRDELQRLARIVTVQQKARGSVLFSEGDAAEGFYVISTGQVRVYKLSLTGKEQTLHIFDAPQPVGEAAVFSGEPYPAHATCLQDSEMLYIRREDFVLLLRQYPEVALHILGTMARRLMHFTRLVESLSLKELPTRLAAYLLHLSERQSGADTVDIEFPKKDLANILGATPETLSRALTRMAREHIIVSQGNRHVTILDRGALTRIGNGGLQLSPE